MVSNPNLQVLGNDLPWARMVLGKYLHSSQQGPRQGLAPKPAASQARSQARAYKDLPWDRMVLGKDSHPSRWVLGKVIHWSLQDPRHSHPGP